MFRGNGKVGFKCSRISIKENVVVPPETEMVIPGTIIDKPPAGNYAAIVEMSERLIEKKGILVAMSLISLDKSTIPPRVANFGFDPCTLYKNTVVATCNPV